jgi:DNA polymerase I
MDKLLIIDGNSIAYRAFYALPLLSNSTGLHTNAVFGFTTMLMKLIEEEKPTHFLVAFDAGKVTFRHAHFAEYKGGRSKTPPELSEQFPVLRELITAFGIRQFELDGYEADDIIGTLTKEADEAGRKVVVVSGDKDMLQLASDNVTIALTRKGVSEVDRYNNDEVNERYGLKPAQIIDLKGLMGDASDNIPGIPGVGEKTALKLLHEYGTVEEVLAHADQIKGKLGEKVSENADSARLSKELATIFREVPMETAWNDFKFDGWKGSQLKEMFRKLEFKSLLDKTDFGTGQADDSEQDSANREPAVPVRILHTEDELKLLVDALPEVTGLYFEVIGDNPHHADVIGAAFHTAAAGFYLPFAALNGNGERAQAVRAYLGDAAAEKVVYDLHRADIALRWSNVALRGVTFDVLLAAYLLDPTESGLSLSGLAARHGVGALAADEDVYGKGTKFRLPEEDQLAAHICRKAELTARLAEPLAEALKNSGMEQLFYELELPLSGVLADMEQQGIAADAKTLERLGESLSTRLEELMNRIYELAGAEFNINSPKQLGEILFEKLGLPTDKKTKTGYSTNAEVLEKLAPYNPIVEQILNYRQLAKLNSTYIEGLLKEIRPETGKVHTYYKQTIAATGRLSSQYPNLQNIPIRMEEGRQIRKAFIPSEPGWHILAADYSQIELRVLAHISQDKNLIEAFMHDLDIHTKTAMDVFGVPMDQVDANMRRSAKAVNFGIVYGISPYGLSQNLNISQKEASAFIEQYFAVFQGVRQFMDDSVQDARKNGYVSTLLGRRRYLPDITASNFNIRSFAERTAMNTPIQGTAADIIKLAMVNMAERLRSEKLKSRMLLQVHDELVFEVPADELVRMQQIVPEVMEQAIKLEVPLKADVSVGLDWYEAK